MLKTLKKKFIGAAMLALTSVITLIIAAINIFNFSSVIRTADDTLALIDFNDGRFPSHQVGDLPDFNLVITPESPYEIRYFTVDFGGDGITSVNTSSIAAVDHQSALKMAKELLDGKKERGFVEHYRFLVRERNDKTRVIFIDCGRTINAASTFLWQSLFVSFIGLAMISVLISIIAERIVRPISDGYEKQKRFITDAGHDIKTPLTIIDADAELLEMENGESEWLTDIKKQTARLVTLTNELIYLTRMEEVGVRPNFDFPLSDVAEEVAGSFASRAKTKNVSLVTDITPALFYFGDEESIRKLITILLDNAIKYSPEGESIELTVNKQGRAVHVKVSNVAPNISAEETRFIFDRFYRSDPARSSGGFGIGLSIAGAIVNQHKGKIIATKQFERLVIEASLL